MRMLRRLALLLAAALALALHRSATVAVSLALVRTAATAVALDRADNSARDVIADAAFDLAGFRQNQLFDSPEFGESHLSFRRNEPNIVLVDVVVLVAETLDEVLQFDPSLLRRHKCRDGRAERTNGGDLLRELVEKNLEAVHLGLWLQ